MTPAQRKRHLVMWSVIFPLAIVILVLGWFGRVDALEQESIDPVAPISDEGAS